MRPSVLTLLLVAAGTACGADWEFDHIVKAIENHYGMKRTHVPLMGVANLFIKVARPAGTSGFKLAVFDDLPSSFDYSDRGDLDRFVDDVCGGGLHALVVTHSRRDGESSYILAGEIGKSTGLLVATFDHREATVVEVKVDFGRLLKIIGSPEEARRIYRNEYGDRDDGSHFAGGGAGSK